MKRPLGYQITEFDCGTTSFINAISYLYEREEIPAKLIKEVYSYTLDCYYGKNKKESCGTSRKAVKKLTKHINKYAKENKFNINCIVLDKENVNFDNIFKCLDKNGVVVARCWQGCEHYVIITKIDKKYAYIFDPYYVDDKNWNNDDDIKIITNKTYSYNRKVTLKRLFSQNNQDFSLGKISNRECILIKNEY